MKRRQMILECLIASVLKRLWMIPSAAIVLGVATFLLGLPLFLDLSLAVLAALCTVGVIARSSYMRHEWEFPALQGPKPVDVLDGR